MMLYSMMGFSQEKVTLSGHIRDASSGEELINASLYIPNIQEGTVSNVYGFYSITVEKGEYDINFSYVGYADESKQLSLQENTVMDIELSTAGLFMEELVISAKAENERVEEVQMSKVNVDIAALKKMPALMGEVDIIKGIQFLPGVATAGEGSSGFYVRGGNVDQNLILLDEAPVYNASHLLGFFSVFNADAIKDVQFYKGAMPARYGGRLSSVVDVRMKDGNSKKFSGSAGIGLISSRLNLESPIGKKGSAMFAARRTYADLFLPLSRDTTIHDNRLYFYDLNGKVNFDLGEKDRLFLSLYTGNDLMGQGEEFAINYGNRTATLRWNHLFSPKLFSNLSIYASDYDYALNQTGGVEGFEWTSQLIDYGVKYDLVHYLNPKNTLRYGLASTLHTLDPGTAKGTGESIFDILEIQRGRALENGVYVSHELEVNDAIKINYGLRVSNLLNLGKQTVYNYNEDYEYVDSTDYEKNEVYQSYANLEPRFGMRYRLNTSNSLKFSYNRTSQYIHLASNTTTASPLDVWFLSSPNIKPQTADQWALGYFKNIEGNDYELSAEVYYKQFYNAVDFKDYAQLLLNQRLEGELRIGKARSMGLELLLQKNTGKLTGWIAYTLGKTQKKIDEINNGGWYSAKYDRTHDLAIIASYDLTKKWNISGNWVYQTGNAVTFPTGKYYQFGKPIPIYSDRNGERMPAYHRLDLAATYNPTKKLFGKIDQSLNISVYNAYARKNAFSFEFSQDAQNPEISSATKIYLFSIIPAFTYNLKF